MSRKWANLVCQKPNLRIAGLIFLWYGEAIQRKGGGAIEYNPTVQYIASMLQRMRPEAVRAVYMVVQELDRMSAPTDKVS